MMPRAVTAVIAIGLCVSPVEGQRFSRLSQIGEEDGRPEYTFGRVSGVALDSGEIFILDGMNAEVRVYSVDGKYLRKFGRSGHGPGEFGDVSRLNVSAGEVRVLDARASRIVAFTHRGEHIRTFSVPGTEYGLSLVQPLRYDQWIGARVVAASSDVIGRFLRASAAEIAREAPRIRRESRYFVAAFRSGAEEVDTLLSYEHGYVQFIVPGRAFGALPGWGDGGRWAVSGDSLVALLDTASGELRVLEAVPTGLKVRLSGTVPVTPRRLRKEDWERAAAVERESGRDLPPRMHLIGPELQPLLGAVLFDQDGTVWVERLRDATAREGATYLRIPLDGRRQSQIQLPPGFELRQVRWPLVLGTRKTAMGADIVELWRIE